MKLKEYLSKIDTKTTGNRYDITTLFACYDEFNELINDLIKGFKDKNINYVAGIDALGFVLATAIAQKLGVGMITIRKKDKLPVESYKTEFIDYSGQIKGLEIRKDILPKNSRVLMVDEWIETGSQISAAIKLVERCGAMIVGIASICMDSNDNTRIISSKYKVHTIWDGNT